MHLKLILDEVTSGKSTAFFHTPVIHPNAESILFGQPDEVIELSNDFNDQLDHVEGRIQSGMQGFALINFEAGYLMENKLKNLLQKKDDVLLKVYLFKEENVIRYAADEIEYHESEYATAYGIEDFFLNTSREEYKSSISKIKDYIAAGDTYQVNYTLKGKFNFTGDPASLFMSLLFNQSARYTAFINNGESFIISLSPELFFDLDNNLIKTKPMKGTIKRGVRHNEDETQKFILSRSEKEKAENLMIVDLMRNDIGRVSEFGSVYVEDLFNVETYESLHQMVTTVGGKLTPGTRLKDVILNLFPCGSVTGAPKIRTMEIIRELEKEDRGIYTGAVGLLSKNRAVFNVAIRTIVLDKANCRGEIGLGSGIVWDGDADYEYDEILLKSRFLTSPSGYFELFETMLVKNNKALFFEEHLTRLKNAALYFLFKFDDNLIRSEAKKQFDALDASKEYRCKMILKKWGGLSFNIDPYLPHCGEINVIVYPGHTDSGSKYLYFKTTNRAIYQNEYARYSKSGFYDVLFFNEKSELTEGAISNVFVRIGDEIFTPPGSCGLLNGIYRSFYMSHNPGVQKKTVSLEDLYNADEIILTNSVRGEVRVNKIYFNEHEFKQFESFQITP